MSSSESDVLVDSFARRHTYLRVSLTERCNLRCTYCMPAEGVPLQPRENLLTFEEIERLVRLFVAAGVDKVRLTGGEPLVRKDVEHLVDRLGAISGLRTLAMTTNGLLLRKKIDRLVSGGLNHLNISLDTLRPDRFESVTRRKGLDIVLDAIDLAVTRGLAPLKINCVVMRGVNSDELLDFVSLARNRALEVRFIEYMPFSGNGWSDDELVPFEEMLDQIKARHPDIAAIDDDLSPGETSREYRIPGFSGSVGFITSMTKHFCGSCNRLRITADGNLKVCLFGNSEVSLRDQMRAGASDEQLSKLIGLAVGRKKASHAGMHVIAASDNRPMILIGG